MTAPGSHPGSLDDIRRSLYSAVVSDALDQLGYTRQSPRVALRPLTGCEKLVGRSKTTLWVETEERLENPYEKELEAVDGCRPDDVVVCAAGGSMRSGIWGELLSTAARNRGCVGVIVDGAVRDVTPMTEMGFPCFARGTCVYDSQNRQHVTAIDVPVEIDGVRFGPGDLIIADRDGIVVVPRAVEEEVLRRAWQKVHGENRTRDAIRGGLGATDAYRKYGIL